MKQKTLAIICLLALCLCTTQSTGYLTLENKYTARMEITDLYIDDVDNDDLKEILATSYDSKLYFLDSNLNLKWKYDARSYVFTAKTLDLDNDGIKEIAVGAASLRALTINNTVIKKIKTSAPVKAIIIDDFDNDGFDDIMAAAGSIRSHTLYIFDKDLNIIWQKTIRGDFPWGIAIEDLNGDGQKEVIVAGSSVLTYDQDTNLIWKHDLDGSAYDLKIDDIDGDGIKEIIVGSHPKLKVLTTEGKLKWEYTTGGTIRSICVTDLEDDGTKEIIVGSDKVYLIDSKGNLIWDYQTIDDVYSIQSGDLNWDGIKEIAVASKKIYVLGNDAKLQWEYTPYRTATKILITDIDNDTKNDLIVGGADHNIYLFKAREIYVKEIQSHQLYADAEKLYNQGKYPEAKTKIDEAITITNTLKIGKCTEDPDQCTQLSNKITEKITPTTQADTTTTQPPIVNITTTTTQPPKNEDTPQDNNPAKMILLAIIAATITAGTLYLYQKKK